MKNLYFVRHGQATNNLEGEELVGGHFDAPLTDRGKKQAAEVAEEIAASGLIFDAIYSSPLQRAYNTAKAIAKKINYPEDQIELLDILKERDFGSLAGKPFEEALGMSMDYYLKNPLSVDHIEGIETLAKLHKRSERIVQMMKQRPVNSVLIVAHGALGRSIRKVIEGVPFDDEVEKIPNAKIVKLI